MLNRNLITDVNLCYLDSVNLIDVTIQILKYITNFRNEIRSQIKYETAQIFRIKHSTQEIAQTVTVAL